MDISNNNKTENKNEKNKHDCVELKNLEYKNVLMYGNNLKPNDQSIDVSELEEFLNKESELNKLDLWPKLDKTIKISKLDKYRQILKEKYNLTDDELLKLKNYFLYCLDRKYFSRIKDIDYNRETGIIENIPNLVFKEDTRTFYIKKSEKHGTTLKSLAPKKNKTIKQ